MRRIRSITAAAALLLCAGATAHAEPIETEGVIRAAARVDIKSKAASPIRRVAVAEGSRVAAGDLLVELVNDVERAQLTAAEAELERSRATLDAAELRARIARREHERNLQVADLLTEKEMELSSDAMLQAESTLEIAFRDLAKAEAQVELSRAIYENSFVRAPFGGVVTRVHVTVGMMPKPTETTLVSLAALDRVEIEVAVPLVHLGRVEAGMKAAVVVEPGASADPPRLAGRVSFVYPEVDPNTRMFRIKVELPSRPRGVLPGMFAKVTLEAP